MSKSRWKSHRGVKRAPQPNRRRMTSRTVVLPAMGLHEFINAVESSRMTVREWVVNQEAEGMTA
jgi:hypothetical protein